MKKLVYSFVLIELLLVACVSDNGTQIQVGNDPDAQVVLLMSPGHSGTGLLLPGHIFSTWAIPELVIYKDGLVLFACREEGWPYICASNVPSESVSNLLEDLDTAGFFDETLSYYGPAGPQTRYYIAGYTEDRVGRISWTGMSFYCSDTPDPLYSTLSIIEEFRETLSDDVQLYEPDNVAVWIWGCDCSAPPSEPSGATCSYCQSIDEYPEWPFDFVPPDGLRPWGIWRAVEVPQPTAIVRLLIPDLANWDNAFFQYQTMVLRISVRPYLPGEMMQTMSSGERWDGSSPVYDTLPIWFPSESRTAPELDR